MSRRRKLEQMLEKNPNDVFLNFALGMELGKEGLVVEALDRYGRVLQLDPTYYPAYAQKADILVGLGRRDEARAALQTGIDAAKAAGDTHAADQMQTRIDFLAR